MSFFPNGTVEASYNGTNYTVPCSQPDPGVVPAPVFCEPPLVLINKDGFPGCALSCPLPALTNSEYENVKLMQGILGWMSWVRRSKFPTSWDLKNTKIGYNSNLDPRVSCDTESEGFSSQFGYDDRFGGAYSRSRYYPSYIRGV